MMYQSRTGLMSHKHLTYYYFLLCTSRCMSHMHLISHKHLTCTVAAAVSVPCQKSRVLFPVVHFKMHEPHAPHQPQTPHLYSGSGRVRTLSDHLLLFPVVRFKMHESHAPHQPQTPHLYSGSGRERTLSEEPRIISRCALQDA